MINDMPDTIFIDKDTIPAAGGTKYLRATTDENLRKAIQIIDEVSFPHPDQQWAIEQLICAAHSLGLLKLKYARMREGVGECSWGEDVKPDLSSNDKNKQETP